MAHQYPHVVGEDQTLDAVISGRSIARFGDGEFKIISGSGCVSQIHHPKLAEEMKRILMSRDKACIVGIPNMDPRGAKAANWRPRAGGYARFLREGTKYYSAFITRPDSAQWLYREDYFDKVESLWKGQDVTLVSCLERSLVPDHISMQSAKSIRVVICPRRDAYGTIDQLQNQVREAGNRRVILCAGAAATCLAHRLSAEGFHALDLGHIGMYWRRTA